MSALTPEISTEIASDLPAPHTQRVPGSSERGAAERATREGVETAPLSGAPPAPDEGPYRIVLTRLQRLVRYRAQLRQSLATDPANQRAGAELIRVGHMVREVHRAVSLNAGARLVAQRIDPEAPPPVTPAPPRLPRF
jgi:hypothetical protein